MAFAPAAAVQRAGEFTEKAPRAKSRPLRGPLRRLLDAVEAANMRKAEREIARYLGGPGAKFTDESEREIERFLSDFEPLTTDLRRCRCRRWKSTPRLRRKPGRRSAAAWRASPPPS